MSAQEWLITGGAGYIGAHVADKFLTNGKEVIIYDSLYKGLESRIEYLREKHNKAIPLIIADIRDTETFTKTLEQYKPDGIIHTAALKAVGESIKKPSEYMEVNFHATTKMLEIITKLGIKFFIFSSTAAVYGAPNHSNSIKEDDAKNPISPYGASKLAAEGEVNKYLATEGNHGTSLRFFNVVGTAAQELLDNSIENLVPIVINKLKAGDPPIIYGTDYPTPDGTCIRDYVDVRDVAEAHLAAARFEGSLPIAMNVGTGRGTSVLEVIQYICAARREANVFLSEGDRRSGDSSFLCADVSLIKHTIGDSTQYSLEESVQSLF